MVSGARSLAAVKANYHLQERFEADRQLQSGSDRGARRDTVVQQGLKETAGLQLAGRGMEAGEAYASVRGGWSGVQSMS